MMTDAHIHDRTGKGHAVGFVFRVPPVCASLEISVGLTTLISDGFNCETVAVAVEILRNLLDKLERELKAGQILTRRTHAR